jgi:hypothetical protein
MKKFIILLFCIMFVHINGKAQMLKGTWIADGNISYNAYNQYPVNTDSKTQFRTFSGGMGMGRAVRQYLVTGIRFQYFANVNHNQDPGNDYKYWSRSFTGKIFLRKYGTLGKNYSGTVNRNWDSDI